MKRLIYAPKVYIFIRSSNLDGRIYDVSSDVVSGSVTQNMGDLSTANFELRNRYQKWLRDDESGRKSIFLPMDLVTIWMQRVAGRPIQVFTGYLNSVPYYQGYPGNASFTASCTLKRLAFTWFDPGLEFFNQWVLSQDGNWVYDAATGEAQSATYNFGGVKVGGTGVDTGAMHDGGFAKLLGRFMIDIAGWGANDVLISELPSDLPKKAAQLYEDVHGDVNTDISNLQQFLGQAMGVPGYSAADDNASPTSDGNAPESPQAQKIFKAIQQQADSIGIPILVPALAAYVLSGYKAAYSHEKSEGELYGYGLYAMRPTNSFANNVTFKPLIEIDGHPVKDLMDAGLASQLFCKRLKAVQANFIQGAKSNDLTKIKQWIEKALGRPIPKKDMTIAFNKAKQYASQSVVVAPKNVPSTTVDPSNVSFDTPAIQKLMTDKEKQVAKVKYKSHQPWLAALLQRAKKSSTKLELISLNQDKDNIAVSSTDAAALKKFFNGLAGDSSLDMVRLTLSGKVTIMRKGVIANGPPAPTKLVDAVLIQQSTKPSKGQTQEGDTSAPAGTSSGGVSFEQLAAFSANAAFAANFAFPSNRIESKFLTGNRALMNDVSCLEGVKQFAQASMRTFRSMPDGRFLAFYPDYFGVTRKPYWKIEDIEIINMGIQLNDDALATHVYVVGDTFALDGKVDWLDEASTRGVATLTQAFMLNSFIEPYEDHKGQTKDAKLGRLQDAWQFLQHYGARPHKEEQPLIRNTAYEFLLAWQRFMQLWASTFATSVEFTFQPEVMAGGLIEFPDHDLQMYCDSVTHTFDYSSGFQTSAVMTSPALTRTNNDRTEMPGFALAGNINTVGAA